MVGVVGTSRAFPFPLAAGGVTPGAADADVGIAAAAGGAAVGVGACPFGAGDGDSTRGDVGGVVAGDKGRSGLGGSAKPAIGMGSPSEETLELAGLRLSVRSGGEAGAGTSSLSEVV
jgi:hypothetical protein